MYAVEKRSTLTRLLRYAALSPYDWRYTLKLPYYLFSPGKVNHCQQKKLPTRFTQITSANKTKFVFAGDLMLLKGHRIPEASQELVDLINSADYFIANCEAPVADIPLEAKASASFTFTMPVAYLEGIFKQFSIDRKRCILGVANNHSRDVTQQVFDQGVELMRSQLGFNVIGRFAADEPPCQIFTAANGFRFAVSAWTHLMNGEKALDQRLVVNRNVQINQFDWLKFKKENQINSLFGLPHWGNEYQHFPYPETYYQAENFITQGFDMLVGAHSHMLQPLSFIQNKICCFSLGNFCSIGGHWRTRLIPLLEVNLNQAGELISYQYHFFVQLEENNQVFLAPISKAPSRLKSKIDNLLAYLFQDNAEIAA